MVKASAALFARQEVAIQQQREGPEVTDFMCRQSCIPINVEVNLRDFCPEEAKVCIGMRKPPEPSSRGTKNYKETANTSNTHDRTERRLARILQLAATMAVSCTDWTEGKTIIPIHHGPTVAHGALTNPAARSTRVAASQAGRTFSQPVNTGRMRTWSRGVDQPRSHAFVTVSNVACATAALTRSACGNFIEPVEDDSDDRFGLRDPFRHEEPPVVSDVEVSTQADRLPRAHSEQDLGGWNENLSHRRS